MYFIHIYICLFNLSNINSPIPGPIPGPIPNSLFSYNGLFLRGPPAGAIYMCIYIYIHIYIYMCISIYMQAAAKVGKPIHKKAKVKATVDKKVLDYRPSVTKPRHYGSVTIYTSVPTKTWRVKPAPGRSDQMHFKYSVSPREHWATLVKHVKSVEQI